MSGQVFLTLQRPAGPPDDPDADIHTFDVSLDYTVTYAGYRGHGPSWTSPGEPPESPEFDYTAYTEDGAEVELTPEEADEAYEALCQAIDW